LFRAVALACLPTSVCEKLPFVLFQIYIWNIKARKVVYLMMQHITEFHAIRFFSSLEDTILPENPVRFIDAFVEALSLQTLGFLFKPLKGRSPEL
jgi:hypothetical protein